MGRKFFIQDWENFSGSEKRDFEELISISLKAKQLRLKLLNINASTTEENIVDQEFAVTGNQDDPDVELMDKVIPRVASFIELRSNDSFLTAMSHGCEDGCERRFGNDPTPRRLNNCLKNCSQNLIAERFLNSASSILLGEITEF